MFITDKTIYIQMQKTGCSHITSLLFNFYGGQQNRKHSAAPNRLINPSTYFLSSIRNPWDWYLSLWTYGVQGEGALMKRLTQKQYQKSLTLFLKSPRENKNLLFNEIAKDVSLWRSVYDKSDKVDSFRKWLKLIHCPSHSHFLGEGYGTTGINKFCGFMSYRYLDLCCAHFHNIDKQKTIADYHDLVQFEAENCYIDFFIRQESLEKDFLTATKKIRPLSPMEKNHVLNAKKVNASKRLLSVGDYYDQETVDLIYDRDKLLINKFGYTAPQIS